MTTNAEYQSCRPDEADWRSLEAGSGLARPLDRGTQPVEGARMIHSGPKPLKVALDITRKLQTELAKQLTPEQRRDLVRVERLIDEAERGHIIEMTRLHHKLAAPPSQSGSVAAAAAAPARKRFWG